MSEVYRFDSNGIYIEPVQLNDNENIPDDCTEIKPEDGLYKAKFENGQWAESLTVDEINTIKNAPQLLSNAEQNQKDIADLTFQLMSNGVI